MTSVLPKIRLGAAIILLCAIYLPLSQCSRNGENLKPPTTQALAHSRHLFPRSDSDYEYQYAIKDVIAVGTNPKDNGLRGVMTLVAFLWPLGFAIWSSKSEFPRFWWIFFAGELLLCAGTAYWIYALAYGTSGRWLYGGYVAEGAIAVYAITTLAAIGKRLRKSSRSN